jgi:hypothetical protein
MQDFVIDQVSWHWKSSSEPPQKTLVRFKAMALFLQRNGLVKRTLLGEDDEPTEQFCIRASDLTDEGLRLMKETYDRWLRNVDQGTTAPDDVSLFERRLARLRSSKAKP